MVVVKIKKTAGADNIPTPSYAHAGDAGLDVCARKRIVVKRNQRVRVPTGIAAEIPFGYAGLIWDKSGLSFHHGLKVIGGVIDAGYRGEIFIGMVNLGEKDYVIERGQKIAQIIIQKVENVRIKVVKNLSTTTRGSKGFGSSGTHYRPL